MSDRKEGPSAEEKLMERTAFIAAQKNAMERGGTFLPHGSRLFHLEAGWESTVVGRDPSVTVVDTLLLLEQALRSPENKTILISSGSLITDQDIERLCQRNGVAKTLFKEVKKA